MSRQRHGLTVLDDLVKKGVEFDYDLKTSVGQTCEQVAEKEGNPEFAAMLREKRNDGGVRV